MSKSKLPVASTAKRTRSKGSRKDAGTPCMESRLRESDEAWRDSTAGAAAPLSEAQRHAMIAENAYYRSLERGPLDGDPVEDWLSAERMIDSAILPHR